MADVVSDKDLAFLKEINDMATACYVQLSQFNIQTNRILEKDLDYDIRALLSISEHLKEVHRQLFSAGEKMK